MSFINFLTGNSKVCFASALAELFKPHPRIERGLNQLSTSSAMVEIQRKPLIVDGWDSDWEQILLKNASNQWVTCFLNNPKRKQVVINSHWNSPLFDWLNEFVTNMKTEELFQMHLGDYSLLDSIGLSKRLLYIQESLTDTVLALKKETLKPYLEERLSLEDKEQCVKKAKDAVQIAYFHQKQPVQMTNLFHSFSGRLYSVQYLEESSLTLLVSWLSNPKSFENRMANDFLESFETYQTYFKEILTRYYVEDYQPLYEKEARMNRSLQLKRALHLASTQVVGYFLTVETSEGVYRDCQTTLGVLRHYKTQLTIDPESILTVKHGNKILFSKDEFEASLDPSLKTSTNRELLIKIPLSAKQKKSKLEGQLMLNL